MLLCLENVMANRKSRFQCLTNAIANKQFLISMGFLALLCLETNQSHNGDTQFRSKRVFIPGHPRHLL